MRLSLIVFSSLLALGCARGPNVSTDQLPLRRVVVYRNGVGYFERSGHVDADQVTFKMRQRMVGDFLATLAIVEHGGSSVRSASFPLEIEKESSEPEPDPRFESMLKPWPKPEDKPDPDRLREVMLSLDGEEHDLAVGYVSETPVWRPSYRLVVQENGKADLQAWGIVQNLSGEDWNGVQLVLVAGAPLAFESTLGEPVIPERPIVTDTGEVIAAVPEGVTSLANKEGEVTEVGGDEPEAPMEEAAAEAAPDDDYKDKGAAGGGRRARPMKKATSKTRGPRPATGSSAGLGDLLQGGEVEKKPLSKNDRIRLALEEAKRSGLSAPRRMSALAAVAVESGATRYAIPSPITVPDESATMVLLLNQRVQGEAVFLFSPDGGVPESSTHPFRVARFKNGTKGLLERGPIAVFEQGSFLGQGMVDPLPRDAIATVPFALERSLAVQSERKYDQQGARLFRIEAGRLTIERDSVTKTLYTVKNGGDKSAKLLVKHPRSNGARLYHPPQGTEDNVGVGNALVPVTVKPYGKAILTVDERRSVQQPVSWLSDLADDAVKAYLADPRANPTVRGQLDTVWKLRESWKHSVDKQQKLVDEQGELEKAARETRLSLGAIEKNNQAADLRVKLTKRLGDITSRMNQITKELIEVKMAINEQEVRFRDAVREIKLIKAPPPKD
ncbi:MAG: DUF4139 domain-containing protein [Myxococcales bacterium]|nr:DUF4139 domain-containing protein [Myxococcales bacterium]MCB9580911.1 DUF4139 domain-containing protein [Polyangiaceae bacterium]